MGTGERGTGERGANENSAAGDRPAGSFWLRMLYSPAFKFILIGLIVLILLIPLFMVWGLVMEREGNARKVRAEIASGWGLEQNVTGPFLIIPFTVKTTVISDGKQVERIVGRRAVFLPDELSVRGRVKSKVLRRSIYEASVYNAELVIGGRFQAPDFAVIAPDALEIDWRGAIFALGLSSLSGLKGKAVLSINGEHKIPFEPSIGVASAGRHTYVSGIHARLFPPDAKMEGPMPGFSFATTISFAGSQALRFAPAGRNTIVSLSSDWPHPSFDGAFLPKSRAISNNGFKAQWQVPHLARSIPQAWVGEDMRVFGGFPGNRSPAYGRASPMRAKMMSLAQGGRSLDSFGRTMFGVRFYIPLDYYDLVNRALKYGLMFLLTAFAGVFVMELLSGRKAHGVQYLFVGVAMVFFFVLLLSFSEHIGFFNAYLLSSLATGGMLSLYVGKIYESRDKGLIMLGLFLVIYGFLYMILRLEDYALLAGAILGFVMLTATMFLTLKVDWSGMGSGAGGKANISRRQG
jgi:inner membrane protein